ncbi:MAG: hypothetical protein ACTSUE_02275 [Promethearchaeota archaeon]
MSIDSHADWARLVSAIVYFLLGVPIMVYSMLMFRHNLRNKLHEYVLRYRKYVNSVDLMGKGVIILSLGIVVLLINQGETIRTEDGVRSQWGWWCAFAAYNWITLVVLANYHRLTVFGYRIAGVTGLAAGVCAVFTSLSGTNDGWILWSVVGVVIHTVAHLFVWFRSQRTYTLIPFGPFMGKSTRGGLTSSPNGHNVVLDTLLLIHSWLYLLLVWLILWLSREVGNVISPKWITEVLYCLLLSVHFVGIVSTIVFQFMDVDEGRRGKKRNEKGTHVKQ